jgi:hypothetical protein
VKEVLTHVQPQFSPRQVQTLVADVLEVALVVLAAPAGNRHAEQAVRAGVGRRRQRE